MVIIIKHKPQLLFIKLWAMFIALFSHRIPQGVSVADAIMSQQKQGLKI